jgi:hypothetical protein
MVTTTPAPRTSAEWRSRSSGLALHERQRDRDDERADARVEKHLVDARERAHDGLIDRRRDDPEKADRRGVVLARARRQITEMRSVEGRDRDQRQPEPDRQNAPAYRQSQ